MRGLDRISCGTELLRPVYVCTISSSIKHISGKRNSPTLHTYFTQQCLRFILCMVNRSTASASELILLESVAHRIQASRIAIRFSFTPDVGMLTR